MGGLLRNVVGGGLAGLGAGMQKNAAESGAALRDRTRQELDMKWEAAKINQQQTFTAGENAKTRTANIDLAKARGGSKNVITPAQAFTMAKSRHTEEVPDGTGFGVTKQVNWDGVKDSMKRAGFGDYAEALIGEAGGSDGGSGNGFDQETAFNRAQAEAKDKNPIGPDWMRPGGMKEAYGNKSEEEWTTDRAQALMGGQGGDFPAQQRGPSAQAAVQEVTAKNPGSKTPAPLREVGTQDEEPAQEALSNKEARRRDAEDILQQATGEMNQLLDKKAERDAWRAEAVQKGRSVPQYENLDKKLDAAISRAEKRTSRASFNLSLITGNGQGNRRRTAVTSKGHTEPRRARDKPMPQEGSSISQPASLPASRKHDDLVIGRWYSTARGVLKFTGMGADGVPQWLQTSTDAEGVIGQEKASSLSQ